MLLSLTEESGFYFLLGREIYLYSHSPDQHCGLTNLLPIRYSLLIPRQQGWCSVKLTCF